MWRSGGVLSVLLVAGFLLAGAPTARAADPAIGPDQAQSLASQLHDWLRNALGPSAAVPNPQVTAEGDHYHVVLPLPGLGGTDEAASANLRPLDGSRWAVADLRIPADHTFTIRLPRPRRVPDGAMQPESQSLQVHVAIADQDTRGEVDTDHGDAVHAGLDLARLAIDSTGENDRQTQRFDVVHNVQTLRPMPDNKFDLDSLGTVQGWRSAQQMPSGRAIALGAAGISGEAHLLGVDRTQAVALTAALRDWATAPTPEKRDRLRPAITASRGLMNSARFDETFDKMEVVVAGMGGATAEQVHLGWHSEAPEGNFATSVAVGASGIALADLPASAASLAPKHVDLGLSLSGVSTAAIDNLALAALVPGANATTLAPQIDALFADPGQTGGPKIGIDRLDFDVGPAQFEGHGSMIALSQSDLRGTARVSVTGFDPLIERMRTDPALQQAVPFLILARGLARTEGSALIWDIVMTPEGITVNGIDPRMLAPRRGARPPRPQP